LESIVYFLNNRPAWYPGYIFSPKKYQGEVAVLIWATQLRKFSDVGLIPYTFLGASDMAVTDLNEKHDIVFY